jgi:energy-coupling factor transporter ATP-binding protein EcfA2
MKQYSALQSHDIEDNIVPSNEDNPPKTKTTLIEILFKYFKIYDNYIYFLLIVFSRMCLNIAYYLIINGLTYSNNIKFLLILLICINFIDPLFWMYIETNIYIKTTRFITTKFMTEEYEYYDNLSYENKLNFDIYEFDTKLSKITAAIDNLINFGIKTFIMLLSSIISCIYIFSVKHMVYVFIIMIILNLLNDKIILRKLREILEKDRINRDLLNDQGYNKHLLLLPMFQYGDNSVDNVIKNLENKYILINENRTEYWNYFYLINKVLNKIPYIFFLFVNNDITTILLLINLIDNLNNSLNSMNNFLTGYHEYSSNLDLYTELKNKYINKYSHNYGTNPDIFPIKLNSKLNDKYSIDPQIEINSGDIIVIRGTTGIGKTTFLNSLLGKTKYQIIDYLIDKNKYFEFYQNIKEKMPTSNITLKDIFYNNQKKNEETENEELLKECLNLCELTNWYNKLNKENTDIIDQPISCSDRVFSYYINTHKTDTDTEEDDSKININIKNKISGGEKARLALATRIYKMLITKNINDHRILILDEPEQGSDSEVAEKILNNFIKLCRKELIENEYPKIVKICREYKNDTTLIIISHLCNCIIEKLHHELRILNMTKDIENRILITEKLVIDKI